MGNVKERNSRGTWAAQSIKYLPLAQVMITESWDPDLHGVPCSVGSPLLSLSVSVSLSPSPPPPCSFYLSNKEFFFKKEESILLMLLLACEYHTSIEILM